MKQKIQFALDTDSLTEAERFAQDLHPYWDILEIGTILLLKEGIGCVSLFRERFPDAKILADTKIVDSGRRLSSLACSTGANIITVLSSASEKTIINCIDTAHDHNCEVLLDHVSENWNSPEFFQKCKLGVDIIGLHIPKDVQHEQSIDPKELEGIINKIEKPISMAGGIDPEKLQNFGYLPIHIFVVGGYLLNTDNKIQNAKLLQAELHQLDDDHQIT